jgi:FkbM family methyltransferase
MQPALPAGATRRQRIALGASGNAGTMALVTLSSLRYRIGTMRRERARVEFYRQFVRRGEMAFDVGAHVGDRTTLLLRTGARVVAVEPQPALFQKLGRAFGEDKRVTLVKEAVGAEPGEAELRWPGDGLALGSMSTEWVERVRSSGRFGGEWENRTVVPVTTLDALIERYGTPSFCKIDVEGYEEPVLRGLSRPISTISIEFTPEYLDSTERALRRLAEIGEYRFDYGIGESLALVEGHWLSGDELLSRLREYDPRSFGDIYACVVD